MTQGSSSRPVTRIFHWMWGRRAVTSNEKPALPGSSLATDLYCSMGGVPDHVLLSENMSASCIICENSLLVEPGNPVQILCGHVFHETCLRDILIKSQSCPTCRRSSREEDMRHLLLDIPIFKESDASELRKKVKAAKKAVKEERKKYHDVKMQIVKLEKSAKGPEKQLVQYVDYLSRMMDSPAQSLVELAELIDIDELGKMTADVESSDSGCCENAECGRGLECENPGNAQKKTRTINTNEKQKESNKIEGLEKSHEESKNKELEENNGEKLQDAENPEKSKNEKLQDVENLDEKLQDVESLEESNNEALEENKKKIMENNNDKIMESNNNESLEKYKNIIESAE
ncbi:unnamed protein product [Cyprideis torosa]|uniref:Uncharacterized protein n=1 Tax=Cyprideis torosa TaxID=163714 RepID=A0A7R8ZHK9_9CRUS|nr:unnamed protein product [Cyprideis torosa]CAG0882750.1 unnamed protein product [Cyprideis torosa]